MITNNTWQTNLVTLWKGGKIKFGYFFACLFLFQNVWGVYVYLNKVYVWMSLVFFCTLLSIYRFYNCMFKTSWNCIVFSFIYTSCRLLWRVVMIVGRSILLCNLFLTFMVGVFLIIFLVFCWRQFCLSLFLPSPSLTTQSLVWVDQTRCFLKTFWEKNALWKNWTLSLVSFY